MVRKTTTSNKTGIIVGDFLLAASSTWLAFSPSLSRFTLEERQTQEKYPHLNDHRDTTEKKLLLLLLPTMMMMMKTIVAATTACAQH